MQSLLKPIPRLWLIVESYRDAVFRTNRFEKQNISIQSRAVLPFCIEVKTELTNESDLTPIHSNCAFCYQRKAHSGPNNTMSSRYRKFKKRCNKLPQT